MIYPKRLSWSHGTLLEDIQTMASKVVEFRGAKSKRIKVKQGVPQGGLLSPILFNFYLQCTYVDDFLTENDLDTICNAINKHRSSATLFKN